MKWLNKGGIWIAFIIFCICYCALGKESKGTLTYAPPTPKGRVLFLDTFQSKKKMKQIWIHSSSPDYLGRFIIDDPEEPVGIEGDKGLVGTEGKKKYAISTNQTLSIDNTNSTFILQFEVRFQKGMTCGGGYLKLLPQAKPKNFTNETPYLLMFGPDKCGEDTKILFIMRKWNPILNTTEEKHLIDPPPFRYDRLSHLFSLIIFPNNTFHILFDLLLIRNGTFDKDFNPPFDSPLEIDDPTEKIPPEKIPDPNGKPPEGWDEKKKGKYIPKLIKNPEFENWKPRKIPNPNYYKDPNPYKIGKIKSIGIEIQVREPKILFDNIFITDNLTTALIFGNETWWVKRKLQGQTLNDVWGAFEEYMFPLWKLLGIEEPSQETLLTITLALPLTLLALFTIRRCTRGYKSKQTEVPPVVSDKENKKRR